VEGLAHSFDCFMHLQMHELLNLYTQHPISHWPRKISLT